MGRKNARIPLRMAPNDYRPPSAEKMKGCRVPDPNPPPLHRLSKHTQHYHLHRGLAHTYILPSNVHAELREGSMAPRILAGSEWLPTHLTLVVIKGDGEGRDEHFGPQAEHRPDGARRGARRCPIRLSVGDHGGVERAPSERETADAPTDATAAAAADADHASSVIIGGQCCCWSDK